MGDDPERSEEDQDWIDAGCALAGDTDVELHTVLNEIHIALTTPPST